MAQILWSSPPQVEKSEARQFLQLAQYYTRTACQYCAKHFRITGLLLTQYVRGIIWQYKWNSEVGISLTVGTQLVYYWCIIDYHYCKNTGKGGMPTLGTVLV